jgi:hypothetical protein
VLIVRTPDGRLTWLQALASRRKAAVAAGIPVAFTGLLMTDGYTGYSARVQHWSAYPAAAGPASSTASSSATWAGVSLHCAPPAPLEASAARPPAARDRRHRFADIRDTRNRLATSRSLAPASIISAAASRTRSRRTRSAASRLFCGL